MNTHRLTKIYHFQFKERKSAYILSQMCSQGIFSKGLKNKYETAVVNESSVFEPLKFYCSYGDKHKCTGAVL